MAHYFVSLYKQNTLQQRPLPQQCIFSKNSLSNHQIKDGNCIAIGPSKQRFEIGNDHWFWFVCLSLRGVDHQKQKQNRECQQNCSYHPRTWLNMLALAKWDATHHSSYEWYGDESDLIIHQSFKHNSKLKEIAAHYQLPYKSFCWRVIAVPHFNWFP